MKVSREEAAANRQRIIEVAGRLFRENGFDGIGVADLMRGAGLTHGGFYGHFDSKDELAAEACAQALARAAEAWSALAAEPGKDPFAAILKRYLAETRLCAPGSGCVLATLGSDAARGGRPVRRAYAAGLEKLGSILARLARGRSKAERRRKALAVLAEMVGAVVLARAVDDQALAREILASVRSDLETRFP